MNKKVFFLTPCLLVLILSLTGCADKQVREERELKIETATENIQEEKEEPEKVVEIEEVKEVEEVIETKEPEEEEIIKETPEEVQEEVELPSQDSYWNLNYFDLTQYLLDCGAKEVTTSNEDIGPIPSIIRADFGDFFLEISTNNYEQVANIFIGTNLPDTYGFYRDFDYDNDNLTTTYIIVDLNDGTMVHQASIEALPDIIKGIKSFTQTTPGERPVIENCIYPE